MVRHSQPPPRPRPRPLPRSHVPNNAKQLLKEMEEGGIEPDTSSYNCALNGLAKCREWYRARRLFRKMGATGLTPDTYSFNGLVEAAGMGSISPRQNMIQVSERGMWPPLHKRSLLFFVSPPTIPAFVALVVVVVGGSRVFTAERATSLT